MFWLSISRKIVLLENDLKEKEEEETALQKFC